MNWIQEISGSSNLLYGVYFASSTIGYAVGRNGTILKTIDSGINWSPQVSGTTKELYSVFFTNINIGYVVGRNGTILKTTNGGLNWLTQNSGTLSNLMSVKFTSSDTGYIVIDNGMILKTINGGVGIKEISEEEFKPLIFPNPATNQTTISYPQLFGEGDIHIYNTLGQLVYEEILAKASSQKEINIQSFKAGLYKIIIRENGIIKGQVSLVKN